MHFWRFRNWIRIFCTKLRYDLWSAAIFHWARNCGRAQSLDPDFSIFFIFGSKLIGGIVAGDPESWFYLLRFRPSFAEAPFAFTFFHCALGDIYVALYHFGIDERTESENSPLQISLNSLPRVADEFKDK